MPKFKLKTTIEKTDLEGVPEAYRAMYAEGEDGKLHLGEIEIDDAAEIRSALENERRERKAAKDALEALKDVDPKEYKRLKDEESKRETKRLQEKGEYEELLKKEQADRAAERQALEAERDKYRGENRSLKLTEKVKASALKNGVFQDDIDDVLTITSGRFDLDDDENIVVKDPDGKANPALTPDKFFGEVFKQQKPKFYQASSGGGSGAPAGGGQGGGGGAKTMQRAAFDALSPQDKSAFIKDGGAPVD
jgi:DNA gyrase/topoisomerase IV subunit A